MAHTEHRHLSKPEQFRCFDPAVAGNNLVFCVDQVGTMKPNRLMLAAIRPTCFGECVRALVLQGVSRASGARSICRLACSGTPRT
jgi:hypothetical protein